MTRNEFRNELFDMTYRVLYGRTPGGMYRDLEKKLQLSTPDSNKPGEFVGISKSELYVLFEDLAGIATYNEEESECFGLTVDGEESCDAVLNLNEFSHWCFQLWGTIARNKAEDEIRNKILGGTTNDPSVANAES